MFLDHYPYKIVNRLYKIVKVNRVFLPVSHHFVDHYWDEYSSENKIILPDSKIFNPQQISIPTGCIGEDNCFQIFQFSKCTHKNDVLPMKQNVDDSLNSNATTYKIASRVTTL